MRKVETFLAEYAKRLSDQDLDYLRLRIEQNLCGDRADVASLLSRDREMDRWLATANGADEFFDMVDLVGNYICDEYDARYRRR